MASRYRGVQRAPFPPIPPIMAITISARTAKLSPDTLSFTLLLRNLVYLLLPTPDQSQHSTAPCHKPKFGPDLHNQ